MINSYILTEVGIHIHVQIAPIQLRLIFHVIPWVVVDILQLENLPWL
jgi:hypothetical protein